VWFAIAQLLFALADEMLLLNNYLIACFDVDLDESG
jgi:hypothetical protein